MDTSDAQVVEQLVDTARYPLSEPGSPAWEDVVSRARHDLHRSGCSVLSDFVRPSLKETLRREGTKIAPFGHYDVEAVNAYTMPDVPLPDDHPGRILMKRGNAFVARDKIPAAFIIHRLYTSRLFQRFVAGCVELPAIYPLADPFAGLCLNVVPPGRAHPWHFDTNEFSVSILTQSSDGGGEFEFCPNIRTPRDENLDDVRSVLNGRRDDLVRRLRIRPGDLQLFKGRFSLHRVSTVEGHTARHSAILSYGDRAGIVGGEARTKKLFGRAEPQHLATERHARRSDRLLG